MRLYGTPLQLDSVLRPFARTVQLAVALPVTAALMCYGAWLWVPLPLALSFLLYEAFFYARGDRACVVSLTETLTLDDPIRGQQIVVKPEEVTSVGLLADADSVTVVLGDDLGICFVGRFEVPSPEGIVLHTFTPLLGPPAGLVRALGPNERVCRQRIRDPKSHILSWLQSHLPPNAWNRTQIRLWRGAAPDLDVFALHKGPPDAVLVLHEDQWSCGESRGMLTEISADWAARQAVLLRPGEGQVLSAHEIPVLLLSVGSSLQLAIPSASPDSPAPSASTNSETFHTHHPEGILLIHHLQSVLSDDTLPEVLVRATVGTSQESDDKARPGV